MIGNLLKLSVTFKQNNILYGVDYRHNMYQS